MKTNKRVAAYNATGIGHPAEDWYATARFSHENSDVVTGAVSDGCSTNSKTHDPRYQPELGAMWLSRQFTKLAEVLYREGLRGLDLGTEVVHRFAADMRNDRLTGRPVRKDLVATLLGFVADEDELLLITGGDGTVFRNGTRLALPETGIYPVHLLDWPEDRWPEVFQMGVHNLNDMDTFAIATDGLTTRMEDEVREWSTGKHPDPDALVEVLASIRPENHGQDDTTIIAMSVR